MPRRNPRSSIAVLSLALLGFRLGLGQIGDNSTFTHIRTGLELVRTHSFPRHDTLSFTAFGHAWRTQSWLVEAIYGTLLRANHTGHLLVVLNACLVGLIVFICVRMIESPSVVRTIGYGLLIIGLGVATWTPRPALFAFACFALLVQILVSDANPYFAIPVAVVWQWSHGSYVIGVGFLVLVLIGRRIEKLDTQRVIRLILIFSGALVVASIFPYGPRSLLFFLAPLQRPEVFKRIAEWHSPDFQDGVFVLTLIASIGFVVALIRLRPAWHYRLPAVMFLMASLWSERNFGFLSVVAAYVLSSALGADQGNAETPDGESRLTKQFDRVLKVLIILIGVSVAATALKHPAFDFGDYPVKAINQLEATGYISNSLPMAYREVVGNYMTCRYGPTYRIFDDDRFELYSRSFERDTSGLIGGSLPYGPILDRYKIAIVIYANNSGLVQWLSESPGWVQMYHDKTWSVFKRTSVEPVSKSIVTNTPTPCVAKPQVLMQ